MENFVRRPIHPRPLRSPDGCAIWLAVAATVTALALSSLAGWQRGGSLSERAVWVAMGVVLILSAHLLPTLIRGAPLPARVMGHLLWGACMVTAGYGHVTFFLLAQQHAGDARAATVTATGTPGASPDTRNLPAVMEQRASVTHQLALARAQRCLRDCPLLEARRVTLAARLDALDAQAAAIRRREALDDRVMARRDALQADPVTSRLAALLSTDIARADLLAGVLFAGVLEGVACLLWTLALRGSPLPVPVTAITRPEHPAVSPAVEVTDMTPPTVTAVTDPPARQTVVRGVASETNVTTVSSHAPRYDPVTPLPQAARRDDDLTQLAGEIAAGRIRPTVASIRQHLGCSQARALTLRRQLAQFDVTA